MPRNGTRAGERWRPALLGRGALRGPFSGCPGSGGCPRRGASRCSASAGSRSARTSAVLVLDEVREDRRREGGVVEPDLVVLATALLGRLGPGRAELDRAGVEAVGGSAFLVAFDGIQRDLGAEVEGLDLALE